MFVPFVHQVMQHLGRYVEPRPWYTVGEAYDPADAPPAGPAEPDGRGAARSPRVSPSGRVVEPVAGSGRRTVPLREAGFYEIRAGRIVRRIAIVVAVNGAVARIGSLAARSRRN